MNMTRISRLIAVVTISVRAMDFAHMHGPTPFIFHPVLSLANQKNVALSDAG